MTFLALAVWAPSSACSEVSSHTTCVCPNGVYCRSLDECGRACSAILPCDPGHACTGAADGTSRCSLTCDSALCTGASICDSPDDGVCVPRQCGVNAGCADSAKFCDVSRGMCLALSGSCESSADCPTLPDAVGPASVDCGPAHVCEIAPVLPTFPATAVEELRFVVPHPGQAYADEDAIELVWNPMDRPALIEIFSRPITDEADFDSAILWGASWQPGQAPPRWIDGFRVDGSTWNKPPDPLPTGVALYAVVLTLDGARLAGRTPLTPFYIGPNPWPPLGMHCADATDCHNPAQPQDCVESTCRLVCTWDRGCATGHLCEPPHVAGGARTCAL